jgi:polysaccharide pyruvyl transferase WcaK-like protein
MAAKILLLGSYNGQDSLGDKCLLKAVIRRCRDTFGSDVHLVTHVVDTAELARPLAPLGIEARHGVQTYFWKWEAWLSRFIRSKAMLRRMTWATFSRFGRFLMRMRPGSRRALQDVEEAEGIVIYGGTNFSRQWWWLQNPPYTLCRRWSGAPVFLAPQQYGPMDPDQLQGFREGLLNHATGVLCRNPDDLKLLGLENRPELLVRDEVFSNTDQYPAPAEAARPWAERDPVLLVNMRFSRDFLFEGDTTVLDRFCDVVGGVAGKLGLTPKLFCMSSWRFADDLAGREHLEKRLNSGKRLEVLPYTDEYDLITAATRARGCISMSFHGCILSMIGGCPSIPVTLGDYYDFKYCGFADYNPSRPIPLISLASPTTQKMIEPLVDYLQGYDGAAVQKERMRSGEIIQQAYRSFFESVRRKVLA